MADDSKTPIYYKQSTDFEKGKQGIEVAAVSSEEQLIEAGVDNSAEKAVMQNMKTPRDDENTYLIVVKDHNDNASRVL